jgi:VWFA-related protein
MALPARVARPRAALAILTLLVGSPSAGARGDVSRAPAERVTTELVLVETYVTDDKGRPIEGLTIDDFTLVIDGKPRPIASLDFRRVSSESIAPGVLAPGSATTLPASGPIRTAEYPRRFMLFFEDRMSAPAGLTAARHAAEQFLSTGLLPSDEVGIATYDTGLRILHDFTSDREALRKTIAGSLAGARRVSSEYAERRAQAEQLDQEMQRYQQEASVAKMKAQADARSHFMGGGGGGSRAGGDSSSAATPSPSPENKALQDAKAELDRHLHEIKSLAMNYAAEESFLLRGVLRGVGVLVDGLAAWPGYKALVFMGDGIPENPANPYLSLILARHPDPILVMRAQQYSVAPDVDAVRRAAAAKGVTIHTLQTRGLAAGTASEMKAQYEESNTIAALALGTGGLRSSSNDFVAALDGFEASSRAYYVIGYSPSGTPDGRYHAVKVRCRKRGAQVRSREGFVRWTPEESRRRAIQAAHLLPDIFPDLRLDLSAAIGPHEGPAEVVDFVAHLPAGAVLFVPEEGGAVARLQVGLVVQDDLGAETFHGARSVRIARPAEGAAERTGIDLYCRLRLPDKGQKATAVVYDDTTGTIGAARLTLPATSRDTARVLGLSLYSVAQKSLWVELPFEGALGDAGGARPASDAGEAQQKSMVGPPVRTTFTAGESAVCGFRRPDQARPAEYQVLIRQDGATLRTVKVPAAGTGSPATVQVALPIEDLPLGDYLVMVQEMRPEGAVDRGAVPLRLQAPASPPSPGARGSTGGG